MNDTPLRVYVATWLALLLLLALTCGSSFIAIGRFNLVANIAIALVKALLVLIVFMRVLKSGPFVKLIAIAGVAWLMILVVLSINDFAVRAG